MEQQGKVKKNRSDSILITASTDVSKYFRSVCVVHGLKPKEQLDKVMSEWAHEYTKKHGLGTLSSGKTAS